MVIPPCEQRFHIIIGFILVKVLEFDYNIYARWNMITLIWKLAFHIHSINHLLNTPILEWKQHILHININYDMQHLPKLKGWT
jgi:hypothetical protein